MNKKKKKYDRFQYLINCEGWTEKEFQEYTNDLFVICCVQKEDDKFIIKGNS